MIDPSQRKSQSGMALIIVMVALAFMTVVIMEISSVSRVDLRIAANARNRLQAQYLANSAANLQILRLHMFQYVKNLTRDQKNLPLPKQMIDRIWTSPLPTFPLPTIESLDASIEGEDGSPASAAAASPTGPAKEESSEATVWPGTFVGKISSEGSKIPINLLDGNVHKGSSEDIAKEVKRQLEELIKGMLEQEEFDELYRGLDPNDLVEPLIDWIDDNNERVSGGDEDRDYEKLTPPYKARNGRIPNLSELHMIQGWTDDLIKRISPDLSTLNIGVEVNPNYVSLNRLKVWGPELAPEELLLIQQKRLLSPFESLEALETYIKNDPDIRGGDRFVVPEDLKKKSTDTETVFVVEATGVVGDIRRNLRLGVIILPEPSKKPKPKPGEDPQKEEKQGKLTLPQVVFVEEFL